MLTHGVLISNTKTVLLLGIVVLARQPYNDRVWILGDYIPTFKLTIHTVLVRILRALVSGGRLLGKLFKPLSPIFGAIGSFFKRWIALPIYKTIMLVRLRVGRFFGSARNLLFFVFTNKYLFHGALLTITLITIGSQFRTQNAAAASEAGTHTLLYSLVTNGQDSLVEEQIHPELLVKNANYLGDDTIEALPDIDFGYDEDVMADSSLPGSIEVMPGDATQPDRVIVRTKTELYTVQNGDTIAQIARNFGIDVVTITYSNNLGKNSYIKPGDKLKIPPVSGVLHIIKAGDTVEKIAQTYSAKPESIYEANRISQQVKLVVGEEIMVPGGVPKEVIAVAVKPTVPKTTIRDKSVDKFIESGSTKTDTRVKPADIVDTAPKAKLLWPTRGHVITQYYGWNHTGVDIDGDYTDPLYAAADGVVETAGWNNGGYGLMIMINHENGLKTRYAHSSKLFVQAGDRVKRGQVIAMLGTTGRSTGTHLHFEVYVNGVRTNPLTYTK